MEQFSEIDNAIVDTPEVNEEWLKLVSDYVGRFHGLERYGDYVEFLKSFGGAEIVDLDATIDDEEYMNVCILDLAGELTDDFGSNVEGKYFIFAGAYYRSAIVGDELVEYVYAFNLSEDEEVGVYKSILANEEPVFKLYHSSFTEWLKLVIDKGGNLLELDDGGEPV
jgi:hypothetical protein